MSVPSTRTCIRCRQPLPDGTSYCVACGCANEGATDAKRAEIGRQMEWRQTWESCCKVFPWLRWFEK